MLRKIVEYEYSAKAAEVWLLKCFSIDYLYIMNYDYQIPEPFLFNPFKHHVGFIKEFINRNTDKPGLNIQTLLIDIRHLGIVKNALDTEAIPEMIEILRD